jgi:hypothetical protein
MVKTITAYEEGDLSEQETLELFSHLVATGLAWELQGSYGRMARNLIEEGWLLYDGTITDQAMEILG